jgi:hypothetical protein
LQFVGNFRKCGFKQETWWDVGFRDLELQPQTKDQKETLSVAELFARPEAARLLERATLALRP